MFIVRGAVCFSVAIAADSGRVATFTVLLNSYYVRPGFTDARKSFRTLSCIVDEELNLDSRSKAMFIFCNKTRNTLKILVSLLPGKYKLDDVIERRKQIAEAKPLEGQI